MPNDDLVYDHYKDTFALGEEHRKQRNKLFVYLCVFVILLFFFMIAPDTILSAIMIWIQEKYSFSIALQLSTLTGFAMGSVTLFDHSILSRACIYGTTLQVFGIAGETSRRQRSINF